MDVRKKLVELLDDMQRSGTGYFGSAIENKKIADYLIRHGVTVQEWIPVTERLPDEHESLFARYKDTDKWRNAMLTTISDRVIVCAEYENGERLVKTANTVDGVWKVKDIFHPCKVTHWMPMPYPPKGE